MKGFWLRPEWLWRELNSTISRLIFLAIGILGAFTYLPAFNNFFISDDFVYISQIKTVEHDLSHIFNIQPTISRLTQSFYFLFCYKLFHLNPSGYYAISLLIHLINSYLVFLLVARLTRQKQSGLLAGLFFAVYERHQEAIMWISAANELILTMSVLLCFLFWEKFSREDRYHLAYYFLSILAFLLSLFSKESSVTLLVLMLTFDLLIGREENEPFTKRLMHYLPLVILWTAYLTTFYFHRNSNPLIAHGYYALTSNFFIAYLRTINRLLLFVYPSLLLHYMAGTLKFFKQDKAFLFLLAWLFITPLSYCFLTYDDRIPSRHTYLPSVATAGLISISLIKLYSIFQESMLRKAALTVFFLGVLLINWAYVWRKDAQFVKRAEPTKVLIQTLNGNRSSKKPDNTTSLSATLLARGSTPSETQSRSRYPAAEQRGFEKISKVYIMYDRPSPFEVVAPCAISLFTSIDPLNVISTTPSDHGKLDIKKEDYVFRWNDKKEMIEVLKTPGSEDKPDLKLISK